MNGLAQNLVGRYHGRPDAGWSSLAARRAHNPKVAGSNPAPATTFEASDGTAISAKRSPFLFVSRALPKVAMAWRNAGIRAVPPSVEAARMLHRACSMGEPHGLRKGEGKASRDPANRTLHRQGRALMTQKIPGGSSSQGAHDEAACSAAVRVSILAAIRQSVDAPLVHAWFPAFPMCRRANGGLAASGLATQPGGFRSRMPWAGPRLPVPASVPTSSGAPRPDPEPALRRVCTARERSAIMCGLAGSGPVRSVQDGTAPPLPASAGTFRVLRNTRNRAFPRPKAGLGGCAAVARPHRHPAVRTRGPQGPFVVFVPVRHVLGKCVQAGPGSFVA